MRPGRCLLVLASSIAIGLAYRHLPAGVPTAMAVTAAGLTALLVGLLTRRWVFGS